MPNLSPSGRSDHGHSSMELKGLEGQRHVAHCPDAEHQREGDELKAKSSKESDRDWGPMRVRVHEQAVVLQCESYARGAFNPELKAWAAKTPPRLKQHLEMANRLI